MTDAGTVQLLICKLFGSVITSQPALSYSSVIATITLSEVTTGELAGSTFITWTGQFSSDAGA